ncbi:MAG: hydroxymethylbilane synthase [Alphaproteobacteria bacterium]|nr:hydroxymethylbilane synthase [Alphaproteobacteria bacterium]
MNSLFTYPLPIKIGTRKSPLALAQAFEVRDSLIKHYPFLSQTGAIQIVAIKTTGDRFLQPLSNLGGKGLFTKEIEEALINKTIDLGVHSMKDMPTELPLELELSSFLPRADPHDVLFSSQGKSLKDLPPYTIVGTSSLRRQALILAQRPDLQIKSLRGNIETRLQKLSQGEVGAIVLAVAGLHRLHKNMDKATILSFDEMLPAVAQGAIGIEIRQDNFALKELLSPLDDLKTRHQITAERACLAELDGSCKTPIAAYAELISDHTLHLKVLIAMPDGSIIEKEEELGSCTHAEELGRKLGKKLKSRLGKKFDQFRFKD